MCDLQTHRLPDSEHELRVVARMVTGDPKAEPEAMVDALRARMAAVTEIYNRIVHHQQLQKDRDEAEFHLHAHDSREEVHQQHVERLALDSPALYAMVQRTDLEPTARRNLYRFLASS
jgi:glutamine synthetase adenylyltransferase